VNFRTSPAVVVAPNEVSDQNARATLVVEAPHAGVSGFHMAQEPAHYFRSLISAYTDSIRASDFKANIAIVFVAVMMGPLVAPHEKFPAFLPLPVVLLPFLIVILCLLICLYPRFPRRGRVHFVIASNAKPEDFPVAESDGHELEELQLRCAVLSHILYWKTLMLQISFAVSIATVIAFAIIVAYLQF
jgi:hypothetical protein